VAALSFVKEVGLPSVAWPDGLWLPVRFRRPVACVATGGAFLCVDADGAVLPGRWLVPPRVGAGWLPVLQWELGRGTVAGAPRERTRLGAPRALDALSVAASMWEALAPRDLEALGRIVVDARRADRASVEEPGVRLLLENGRLILFGRPACTREPGELPLAWKWRSVSLGLAALRARQSDRDWDLLDVRWDAPEWRLAGATRVPPGS
jgi:hypothetical protein